MNRFGSLLATILLCFTFSNTDASLPLAEPGEKPLSDNWSASWIADGNSSLRDYGV